MQDNPKDQDRTRRTNPIRIVEGTRIGTPQADALREVHSSLVRAGQNLYNLVQSNQAQNGAASTTTGLYPQGQAFAPASTAPGYAPAGFATGFAQPSYQSGIQSAAGITGMFGIAPTLAQWGSGPVAGTPLKALATDIAAALGALQPIAAALGSLQHAAAIVPGTLASPAYGFEGASRAPACDVFDEGKQFVCLVDLPGLKASQIELLCVEQAFVVAASRDADGDAAALVHGERAMAGLQRTVTLPAEIQPAGVKATLSNGVLTVVLPKLNPTDGPRRVKVQG